MSFMDYYQEELRKRQATGASSAGPQRKLVSSDELKASQPEKNVFTDTSNPIGWTLDMLSRPLFGVTNVINKTAEQAATAQKKANQGDVAGAILEGLGTAAFAPGRVLEGIFSNDAENKRYTADTIEHVTDTFGANDPNYKDTENNVDPLAKGILGFIGDVGLDPLTYIPGAQIAKVGNIVGQGAKGALRGARGAVEGAAEAVRGGKAVEQAVAEVPVVAEVMAKTKKPKAVEPAVDNPFGDTLVPATAPAKTADDLDGFLKEPSAWAHEADAVTPSVVDQILPGKGQTFLVTRMPKQPAPKAAVKVEKTVKAGEAIAESAETGKTLAQIIAESPRSAPALKEVKDLQKVLNGTGDVAAPVAVVPTKEGYAKFLSENADQVVRHPDPDLNRKTVQQLRVIASDKARPAVAVKAQQLLQRAYVDSTRTATEAVSRGVEGVARKLQTGETHLRNIIGDDLFDMLSTTANAGQSAALKRQLIKLDTIFRGGLRNPEAFAKQEPRLMGAVQAAYRTPFTEVKGAAKAPEQVAEIVQEMQASPVAEAFAATLREENLPGTPEFKAKYPEFARTNPVAKSSDGTADWWRLTNTFTQYGVYRRLQSYIEKQVASVKGTPRNEMFGPARAKAQRVAVEELGQEISDAMETFGTGLYIGIKGDTPHLAFPEVYREVGRALDSSVGEATTNFVLHNGGTAIPMTRLLNVVAESIMNPAVTREELVAFLRKKTVDWASGDGKKVLPNNMLTPKGSYTVGQWAKAAKRDDLFEVLADGILAARPVLAELAEKNAAEWAARGISEARELAGNQLRKLTALTADGSKIAQKEMAVQLARQEREVAQAAAEMAATPEGTNAAAAAVEAAVGPEAIADAKITVKQDNAIKAGDDLDEAGMAALMARVAEKERFTPEPEEMVQAKATDPVYKAQKWDVGEKANKRVQDVSSAAWSNGRASRMFNPDHDIAPELRGHQAAIGNSVGELVTRDVLRPVKELLRKYGNDTLGQAVKAVQSGIRLSPDSPLAGAAVGIEKVLGRMFDTTGTAGVGNVFLDAGPKVDSINKVLDWAFKKDIGPRFDKVAAEDAAKEALGSGYTKAQLKAETARQLKEQWKTWDLSNETADTLVKLGQAAARVVEHQAVVADFMHTGLKHGFVWQGKGKPPAGFVKLVDGQGSTQLVGLLPKGTYVSQDVAPTFARMEYLTTASRQVGGEVGDFLRGTLLPMTNVWKQGMTIYRLGHHIRNTIGNMSLQYVARGTRDFQRSQTAAIRLLARREGGYEGVDFMKMLASLGDDTVPTGGEVLVRGRYGDISQDEILNAMSKHGLFPTYESSEGLLTGEIKEGGLVERVLRPLDASNNVVGRLGGKVSEATDHQSRAAHFIQALMQESRKSGGRWGKLPKEQLFERVAKEVRRLHPDSSTLTPFENKYMKLAIPFYSWLRGVLPGALESAAMHPGRVMVFPKASYDLAISMGLDPNSLADPFPEDQLFPSFIREAALGPQFKIGDSYIRVNPGIAQLDIAESLGLGNENPVEGVLRGLLGMTNPLVRVPAELASGGSWSTGGRIKDQSDYIDQSIPFVNYLSNLSGISLTGSVGSLPTGGGLDAQASAANKGDLDRMLTGLNWLTGIGMQNLSRPNYINYAEIERRNEGKQ